MHTPNLCLSVALKKINNETVTTFIVVVLTYLINSNMWMYTRILLLCRILHTYYFIFESLIIKTT